VRAKLTQEQSKIEALRRRATAGKTAVLQLHRDTLQKLQDARCREKAAESVREGTTAVEAAEATAAKAIESAKVSNVEELGSKQLQAIIDEADATLRILAEAKASLIRKLEAHDAYQGPSRGSLLEARVELTKLSSRTSTSEKKVTAATEAVRAAMQQLMKATKTQAIEVLRDAAKRAGSCLVLFIEIAGGSAEITEGQFVKFLSSLPAHNLSQEQASLVYRDIGPHGLGKAGFMKALQEFAMCQKTAVMSSSIDISSSAVRKMDQGEIAEVFEGPTEDAETKVQRVRVQCLRDSTEGWVTLKSNQGTVLLKKRDKPFLTVSRAVPLLERFEDESPVMRSLEKDEVLELLEGPRPAVVVSEVFLRSSACKDGAEGWLLLKDASGTSYASASTSTYVCKSTIAMTENLDTKNGKTLRKVQIGETLEAIADAEEQEQSAANAEMLRKRFRANDGKEGWVTIKGNLGTVYLEASKSHHVVEREVDLLESAARGATVVRSLATGEVLEELEPPKEVKPEAKMGARVRSMDDGKVGWIDFEMGARAPGKPWKQDSKYTCRAQVALTSDLSESSEVCRVLEPGETLKALDATLVDSSTGRRRLHCISAGGTVGWVTLRGGDGTAFVEL